MFLRTCAPLQGAESRASMAIYHLSASIVKRSAGRSVTAAAAYRAASKIEDLTTGITHDYTRKKGVDHSEIISPISASLGHEWLTNRQELWNKIEEVEKRKDAQLAREVTLALPVELPRDQQIALVREYVQRNYVAAGMIADINIHHLDGDNPHAHILLSMRNLQTTPEGTVQFGLKNTSWNSKDLLFTHRKNWEEITNKYLANYGSNIRIDCRSLKDQESPYIPQIHVGVHAMAMKRKGISTDRSEEYDRIEAANNDIRTNLERIYQQEYTEPEQESELTEQQQQIAADRKLAELIIQVMPPTSKETQTFGVYTIKPYNNGYQVRSNNNHNVILNLKLENDIWVKSIRYHIKGNQRKHIYSNSDIDAKVEDFTKVIEDHKRRVNDLKIQNEAEKERIRTEIQIQKVNKEKAKAEAQIKKINNALLKPQKAEERRVKMEAQKIETKQRNLKKAEDRAASQIIANAERQVRLEAQKIETKQRQIERDKIKAEEAQLAYERRKAERERVATEINKAGENICHLLQNAVSVKFEIEGNILWITRDNESHIIININKHWYDLYSGYDNNYSIRENHYNIQPIDDLYKSIEKCLQIGTLISKTEKESEPVTTLLEEELAVSETKEIDLELQVVVEEEQIRENAKVQQPKITQKKKLNRGIQI
jgi:MobA/MobL family